MKKYLALALIAALAAFAVPAMAETTISSDTEVTVSENSTWNNSASGITSITFSNNATLSMSSGSGIDGANATISGSGMLKGDDVNDLYGISSVNGITIDAAQTNGRSTNMQLAAATKGQPSGSVSLTMTGVAASPGLDTNKHYLKVAPQFVRNDAQPETSELESARITVTDSAIGHSLFGGPLAISGNSHNLKITNSEIVINGDSQIGRAIYAGGGVWGTYNKTRVENARIIVNGGTIGGTGLFNNKPTENGYIYGGGLVENDDTTGSSSTVGNVEIIINGGSVEGGRGGGRIDTNIEHGADVTKVDNVIIVIDGAATIGEGGVKAGSENVKRGTDNDHSIVADSVADATITLQNVASDQTISALISGEGAETATVELMNVQGTLDKVTDVDTVGVDPNTSVALTSVTGKEDAQPKIALVGDWRDTSGVQEFNLDEMIKVSGKTADELFSNADSPVYDPAETGITSLTRNADGSFRATVDRPAGTSGGGGGGCSAGFGALALLAALPLIRMRKK